MFLKVSRVKGSLSLVGMLYLGIGVLFVVMVHVVPFLLYIPWENWVPPDLHGFYRWVFDSFEVLNSFVRQVVVSRRG